VEGMEYLSAKAIQDWVRGKGVKPPHPHRKIRVSREIAEKTTKFKR